jgi:hypothetical protein
MQRSSRFFSLCLLSKESPPPSKVPGEDSNPGGSRSRKSLSCATPRLSYDIELDSQILDPVLNLVHVKKHGMIRIWIVYTVGFFD